MASENENAENEAQQAEESKPLWYILKVQVNREDRVMRELERRVDLAGLRKYVEEVRVPIEHYTEIKGGRKRAGKRKLFPGYLMVKMVLNDETWFLMRDTPGVGDFTGSAGKPLPMTAADVERALNSEEASSDNKAKLEIPYNLHDRVKINEGTFKDIEGEVAEIDAVAGSVTVNIVFLNRNTPVTLEYWQVEKVEV